MKAMYKMAAVSTVVFSTLAIIGTAGSGAAVVAASNGSPEDAYCFNVVDSGLLWSGYATFSQCEQRAEGTGADSVANVLGKQDHRPHEHATGIR